jgi:hypothetical protein
MFFCVSGGLCHSNPSVHAPHPSIQRRIQVSSGASKRPAAHPSAQRRTQALNLRRLEQSFKLLLFKYILYKYNYIFLAAFAIFWLFLICFIVWLVVLFILALRLSVSSRNSFKYTLFINFWLVLALFWFGLFLCFHLQLPWLICNFL